MLAGGGIDRAPLIDEQHGIIQHVQASDRGQLIGNPAVRLRAGLIVVS